MKQAAPVLLLVLTLVFAFAQQSDPLYWAYPVDPPSTAKPHPPSNKGQHVPGSSATFTKAQIDNGLPDWHPKDHPPMPSVVAKGQEPSLYPCGYCHLPNGLGRPENATLAGLPVAYITQQLADFKNGLRKSSVPQHLPTNLMIGVAKQCNADQVRVAATYFASLKLKPWIRVVESAIVPKTHVAEWMLIPSNPAGTEAIGDRIIELPEDLNRTELRDDRSGFIAYVPVGSVQEGKTLASGTTGKTVRCSVCHGDDLRGRLNVPALAGRSPSYLVRQMNDIQNGNRHGVQVGLMKPAVRNLTVKDMIALAAYCASLQP